MITEKDVLDIQKSWSAGLLKIVEKHKKEEDYILEATNFIEGLYAYDLGNVLFNRDWSLLLCFFLLRRRSDFLIGDGLK